MESQKVLIYDSSDLSSGGPIARLKSCFVPRVGEIITVKNNDAVCRYKVQFIGYMADAVSGTMLAGLYCKLLTATDTAADKRQRQQV